MPAGRRRSRAGFAPRGALLGEWFASQPNDFNRAHDTTRILPVNFPERHRVKLREFAEELGLVPHGPLA